MSHTQLEVRRGEYLALLKHLTETIGPRAESERVVPGKNKQGRLGLHLFGIRPNASCGLVNGDLVLAVNGHEVADVQTFPSAVADWSDTAEIVVELERETSDGVWVPLRLYYRVIP